MKIIFVPNYFYLHIPLFQEIIYQLSDKGVTSYIWKLPGNTNIPADKEFDSSYFRSHGINFYEAPIYQTQNYKGDTRSKFRLLRHALKNRITIRRLLQDWKPDLVVVGSDLGNLNIRFLMDACHYCNIPVVVLYNCDVPKDDKRVFRSLIDRYIFRSKLLTFFRAILFSGNIPGKYAINSTICVATEEIKQKIVAKGINSNRVIVTGIPFLIPTVSDSSENILKKLDISDKYRLVVFFTQCIQNIYGIEYATNLFIKLSEMVEHLSDDVFFLIKLHPQESEEMISFITRIFDKPRCSVIASFKVEDLIKVAELCMSDYSRVLIIAAMLGKRFVSINFMKDRERTFISSQEGEILEITAYEDLAERITRALDDDEFKQEIDKMVASIAYRFSSHDGFEKIISVILNKKGCMI